jgi:hypothetical protein
MMLLEARHMQYSSMMFVTLATLVVKMQHLRTRCDTYNTCNDDTCRQDGTLTTLVMETLATLSE